MQAAELVAFAIDFEISMSKLKSEGGRGRVEKPDREQGVRVPQWCSKTSKNERSHKCRTGGNNQVSYM